MKSAATAMNPRARKPLARPSKLPSPRNLRPKWSPSAHQEHPPMVVTDMVDMEVTVTNTVTKLPKKPNTTYHLSQL